MQSKQELILKGAMLKDSHGHSVFYILSVLTICLKLYLNGQETQVIIRIEPFHLLV